MGEKSCPVLSAYTVLTAGLQRYPPYMDVGFLGVRSPCEDSSSLKSLTMSNIQTRKVKIWYLVDVTFLFQKSDFVEYLGCYTSK